MNPEQDRTNLAACLLTHNLERHPDKAAYICNDEIVSYRQLAEGAWHFASLLRENGIKRGDRVLIALLDSPVFVAAFLGVCRT
jgi:benzoate-CoA ligase